MNKKAAALFLLTIGTASAAIPLAAIMAGFVLGGAVVGSLEYLLGIQPLQIELSKVKQAYESYLVNDTYQDNFVAANKVKESHQSYSLFLQMIDDWNSETDALSWTVMKRIYLDLRAEGYNHTYAKNEALGWLLKLYSNKTLTVQERSKLAAQVTCSAWETMVEKYAACAADSNCDETSLPYLLSGSYSTKNSNLDNCTVEYNGDLAGTDVFGGRGAYRLNVKGNYLTSVSLVDSGSSEYVYIVTDFTSSFQI